MDVPIEYWEDLLQESQTGGSLSYFVGEQYQRGAGLGSIFKSIFRVLTPFAKRGLKTLGKEAVRVGTSVAADALSGADPLQSLEHQFFQVS